MAHSSRGPFRRMGHLKHLKHEEAQAVGGLRGAVLVLWAAGCRYFWPVECPFESNQPADGVLIGVCAVAEESVRNAFEAKKEARPFKERNSKIRALNTRG